jgi:hypothetical protein
MKLDLNRLEQEFIAEGTCNGDLDPIIVRDPANYEEGDDVGLQLNFSFNIYDWKALYFGELKCPEDGPYTEGEDPVQRHNRWMATFQDCCADFPLLGRIYDMYADAIYCADEVSHFKAQCQTLLSRTQNKGAWRALAKLIVICSKAEELNKGILFACD